MILNGKSWFYSDPDFSSAKTQEEITEVFTKEMMKLFNRLTPDILEMGFPVLIKVEYEQQKLSHRIWMTASKEK